MPRNPKRSSPDSGFEDSLDNPIINNNYKRRKLTIASRKRHRDNNNDHNTNNVYRDSDLNEPPRKRQRIDYSSYYSSSEEDAYDYPQSSDYNPSGEEDEEDSDSDSDSKDEPTSSAESAELEDDSDIDLEDITCTGCIDDQPNQDAHNYPGGCCYSGEEDSSHPSDITSNDDLWSDDEEEKEQLTEVESDSDNDNANEINWNVAPTDVLRLISERFARNESINATIDNHLEITKSIVYYPYNSYQRLTYIKPYPNVEYYMPEYRQNDESLNKVSDIIRNDPSQVLVGIIKIRDQSFSTPRDWTHYRQHYCQECGDQTVLDSSGVTECCISCRHLTEIKYSYVNNLDYINEPRR